MVEIRVETRDRTSADTLLQRMATVFERSAVSFDRARSEVQVRSEWESRAVVQVVDVVEAWLGESGLKSAKLWLGDRSYTLVRPAPATGGL